MSSIWDKWKDTKIIYPKRKHLKLKELDKIPYYNENNEVINHKKFEREEHKQLEALNSKKIQFLQHKIYL